MAFTSYPSAGSRLSAATLQSLISELRPLYSRKSLDQSVISSTTLVNATSLALSVEANTEYALLLKLIVNSAAAADIKFGWTYPTGTTMFYGDYEGTAPAAASVFQGPTIETTVPAHNTTGSDQVITFDGLVIVGSTAGTLQLQFAQLASTASNTTIKSGSTIELLKRT